MTQQDRPDRIIVCLSNTDIERLDQWRNETEPVESRSEAAEHLISIALDEAEMKGTGFVSVEVIEELALAISMALKLGFDARHAGLDGTATDANRIHMTLQSIGCLLGVKTSQLSSVLERLEAIQHAPDEKH